jgi:thiamine biosynthesis lipoprotein
LTAPASAQHLRPAISVMGTVVSLDLRCTEMSEAAMEAAVDRARGVLTDADALFSTWKPNSPMSRIRRGELAYEDAPAVIEEVVARCRAAFEASEGWFDPWAMPGGFDPTGLVKGWAAQRALEALREDGITAAMVNAGGDIATYGEPGPGRPWRLGIRDPLAADRLSCVVAIDGALATSGSYERGAHILDPHTGTPASSILSASVVGPDLGLADALATALCAAGPEGLEIIAALDGYRGMTIDAEGNLEADPDFPFATA